MLKKMGNTIGKIYFLTHKRNLDFISIWSYLCTVCSKIDWAFFRTTYFTSFYKKTQIYLQFGPHNTKLPFSDCRAGIQDHKMIFVIYVSCVRTHLRLILVHIKWNNFMIHSKMIQLVWSIRNWASTPIIHHTARHCQTLPDTVRHCQTLPDTARELSSRPVLSLCCGFYIWPGSRQSTGEFVVVWHMTGLSVCH